MSQATVAPLHIVGIAPSALPVQPPPGAPTLPQNAANTSTDTSTDTSANTASASATAPADLAGTTWASRSGADTIPTRGSRPKVPDALKPQHHAAQQVRREANELLNKELHLFAEQQDALLVELAKRHDKKPERMRAILTHSSSFKKKRGPTLQNALLHVKALEVNSDRDTGYKHKLKDLREMIKYDEDLQDLTKEEEDAFIQQLVEYRELKAKGARIDNGAAAADVRLTLDKLNTEINNLADRCGTFGFCFVVRGNINDIFAPGLAFSEQSLEFIREVLQQDPDELLRRFESWAVVKDRWAPDANGLGACRHQCSDLIVNNLKFELKQKKVAMNYKRYDEAKERWGVELIGWPADVEFMSPSEITDVDSIRKLRDALKSGTCRWRKMSRNEVKEWSAKLAARRAAGELVGTTRKRRSDAGKKRKLRKGEEEEEEEEEEEPRRKKAKRAKTASTKAKKSGKDEKKQMTKRKGGMGGPGKGKGKERQMRVTNQVPRRSTFAPRSKQVLFEDDESSDSNGSSSDSDNE